MCQYITWHILAALVKSIQIYSAKKFRCCVRIYIDTNTRRQCDSSQLPTISRSLAICKNHIWKRGVYTGFGEHVHFLWIALMLNDLRTNLKGFCATFNKWDPGFQSNLIQFSINVCQCLKLAKGPDGSTAKFIQDFMQFWVSYPVPHHDPDGSVVSLWVAQLLERQSCTWEARKSFDP